MPTGLNVNQYYVDSEAIRLKPFKYKKNTFSIKINTNKVNKTKQIKALMPNLIHSLDAASLCLILDMFSQEHEMITQNKYSSSNLNFFSIHDCFGVTVNNVVNLIKIIKLVYIKIYTEDSYLKRFDQCIINNIRLHFGEDSLNEETRTIKVDGYTIQYPDVNKVILGKIKSIDILNSQYCLN